MIAKNVFVGPIFFTLSKATSTPSVVYVTARTEVSVEALTVGFNYLNRGSFSSATSIEEKGVFSFARNNVRVYERYFMTRYNDFYILYMSLETT